MSESLDNGCVCACEGENPVTCICKAKDGCDCQGCECDDEQKAQCDCGNWFQCACSNCKDIEGE